MTAGFSFGGSLRSGSFSARGTSLTSGMGLFSRTCALGSAGTGVASTFAG
jgi:hypothetical protein